MKRIALIPTCLPRGNAGNAVLNSLLPVTIIISAMMSVSALIMVSRPMMMISRTSVISSPLIAVARSGRVIPLGNPNLPLVDLAGGSRDNQVHLNAMSRYTKYKMDPRWITVKQKVVTYAAPNGETINLTPAQIRKLEDRKSWPRNASGEYCTVSHGAHYGTPTFTDYDVFEDERDEDEDEDQD